MKHSRVDLPLCVVGCDFRKASSSVRSKLVLNDAEAIRIFQELKNNEAADGFVDLHTCNRNEWLVSSNAPQWAAQLLRAQFVQRIGDQDHSWFEPYTYLGEEAARHIFRVTVGQESLVIGERQIGSQLQKAFERARERRTSSRVLNGLGTIAGRLARTALRKGYLGPSAIGIHSLAVSYIRHKIPKDRKATIAVIGLGTIGRRVLSFLAENPLWTVIACNRTIPHGRKGAIRPLSMLARTLAEVDTAVVCTSALQPVVRPEQWSGRNVKQPLLILDIGIPEQVVRTPLPKSIVVAGLDELTNHYYSTYKNRLLGVGQQIDHLVEQALETYKMFCSERLFAAMLETVRKRHKKIVIDELPQLLTVYLDTLPPSLRSRLELDLRAMLLSYTKEMFHAIKETSIRFQKGEGWLDE
jgi:glutamyl-tRNA reductase